MNQVKQQQQTLLEKVKDKVGSLFDDAGGKLSKKYGGSLKLQVGEQVPLGVFLDRNDAIGFASLAKYRVSAEGEHLDYLVAGGTSFMRVKGKILYAYVYSNYQSQSDLEWVRITSRRWIDQILSANIAQGSLTQPAYRSASASGFDWHRVIEKGIVGAIVGGLLALIVGVIKGSKRMTGRKKSNDA